jgi:predicted  nucleic acid-binding Zn-ribbon protein
MEIIMSDNHAIEALSERIDNVEDIINEIADDAFEEISNLSAEVKEIKSNITSVISMFTQMNISLLQIQSEVLNKEEK